VGHHAMESASFVHGSIPVLNKDLTPLLQDKIDMYACGHDHNLQHIKRPTTFHHIVSGGGSYSSMANSLHPINQRYPGLRAGEATFGFATVTVNATHMYMEFIDYFGKSIYNTTISKSERSNKL
jgi:tartrate-resistant acid phosphatase type 5